LCAVVAQPFRSCSRFRIDVPFVYRSLVIARGSATAGTMSLSSCPVCGYAVSTSNGLCRHCPAPLAGFTGLKWRDAGLRWKIAVISAVVCVVVLLLVVFY
jgi:hypothetical protein